MKKAVATLLPYMEAEKATATSNNKNILMATVKGDVHDIGKNIVGVVLQCNGYDVIDLGVMVPANKIIETAKAEKVDAIGLSGLITPSLEEMSHLARELARNDAQIPLLIGGATTSKMHTAVKIDPHYDQTVVHVADASRCVGVVNQLFSDTLKVGFETELKADYDRQRERFAAKDKGGSLLTIEDARKNGLQTDWNRYTPPKPAVPGITEINDISLAELRDYIDWTPFFHTWELKGKYPRILEDLKFGVQAKELFDDAQQMLDRLVSENRLQAKGVAGFFPANSINSDDIEIYTDLSRQSVAATLYNQRQQTPFKDDRPNLGLADFVAPKSTNLPDYIGGFAVTAGLGLEELVNEYEANNDIYHSIMAKALADRLAEAFAEWLHEKTRKELWAYAPDENLEKELLIREQYQGIRPAPGYPANPDHRQKATLWKLLNAEAITGIGLTESYAMTPAASVSGWYFSHPEARYFGIGKLDRDQVSDYAKRQGQALAENERWLATHLAYH